MSRPSHDTPVRALPRGVDELIARALECTSAARIRDLLTELPVLPSVLAQSASFGEDGRSSRALHEGEHARLLLLGWLPGRGSAIQSYGRSANIFRVLRGVATEMRYEVGESRLAVELSHDHFLPGSVVVCEPGDVHAILNDSAASEPLVTLHVFQPAPSVTTYRPASTGGAS